jgi:AbiV family abortive infection protein
MAGGTVEGTVVDESEKLHAAGQAVLENTLRLYRDAQLLLKNERFASCLSVSVLAAEELAKFLSLLELQGLKRSEWRNHHSKHVGTAAFLLRRNFQAALHATLEGRAEKADQARLAQLDFGPEEMALFDEVLSHVVEDGSLIHFYRAHSKEMDGRKQRGFYVDLKEDLTIVSDPKEVTSDEASEQLKFVGQTLRVLRDAMDHDAETIRFPEER